MSPESPHSNASVWEQNPRAIGLLWRDFAPWKGREKRKYAWCCTVVGTGFGYFAARVSSAAAKSCLGESVHPICSEKLADRLQSDRGGSNQVTAEAGS